MPIIAAPRKLDCGELGLIFSTFFTFSRKCNNLKKALQRTLEEGELNRERKKEITQLNNSDGAGTQ